LQAENVCEKIGELIASRFDALHHHTGPANLIGSKENEITAWLEWSVTEP
jgi:hypothetical protein